MAAVRMTMTRLTTARLTAVGVSVAEGEDTDEVDEEASNGDHLKHHNNKGVINRGLCSQKIYKFVTKFFGKYGSKTVPGEFTQGISAQILFDVLYTK